MKSKINQILEDISRKKLELIKEYEKLKTKYNFDFIKGKIVFTPEAKLRNRQLKEKFPIKVRQIISAPFIYMMIFPTIILDIFLIIYQNICFRLYKIPLVKRNDYIVFDRRFLDYLSFFQKIHCLYCSYVNGVYAFGVEIAGRTEKYWCPIKYAKRIGTTHYWHQHFADYGDAKGFKKVFNKTEEFYNEKNS